MINHLLALGAGMATAGSPCILPMLPLVLAASVSQGSVGARSPARHRPLFIVLGFVLSFTLVALAFGASAQALGVPQQSLRTAGLVVMALMGLLLCWPALLERLMALAGGLGVWGALADMAQRLGHQAGASHVGGLLLGMSLGLLWTPCAGPVLATVLALIATEQHVPQAASLLLAYAVGAGLPMLALAYGGQAVARQARSLQRHAGWLRQAFGALVMATTVAMFTGADVTLAAHVSRQLAARPVDGLAAPAQAASDAAPALRGITHWFNSPPLTLDSLRGHVVLIDFWTYACVNCINTVPHLQRWHRLYQDKGLIVIGVHTPEFGFERDPAQVQAAIQRLGISYPVALDNQYATWQAWHNQAWPALYLVDTQGRIVFSHVGEGDYKHIETQLQNALR